MDNELETGTNPVRRVLLSASGNEGDLFICPIHTSENNATGNGSSGSSSSSGSSGATGNGGSSGGATGNGTEVIFTMQHQIAAIHQNQTEMRADHGMFWNKTKNNMTKITRLMQ